MTSRKRGPLMPNNAVSVLLIVLLVLIIVLVATRL